MTYAASWALACLIAAGWLLARRRRVALFTRAYWRFLAAPWKLATFALAGAGLVVLGPYTGDPTWDWVDAGFMSVFTFATAPWAVAAVYRAARGRAPRAEAAAAVVGGLFWNLERMPDGTLLFAFTREPWPPARAAAAFRDVAWPALLLMALVTAMVVPLLWLTR